MRTIGLLGGMSWESSVHYERLINTYARDRRGGVHSADLIVRSYDFGPIEELQRAGEWVVLGEMLANDAQMLQDAGAEVIGLCTNTMHLVAGAIEERIDVEFVHIADATGAAIRAAGVSAVGLLGTRFTMERAFYVDRLRERCGLEVFLPDVEDRRVVDEVIFDELVKGVINPASKAAYLDVVGRLEAVGAAGIIAGCTEIELLLGPDDVAGPYFPTAALHARAIAEAAFRR